MLEVCRRSTLLLMSGIEHMGVDLFDDPSWGSDDDKAYERFSVSGFSSRTETMLMILAIGFFAVSAVVSVVLLRGALDDVTHFFNHLFDGFRL